jgi:hypothetical protein
MLQKVEKDNDSKIREKGRNVTIYWYIYRERRGYEKEIFEKKKNTGRFF